MPVVQIYRLKRQLGKDKESCTVLRRFYVSVPTGLIYVCVYT